MFRLSVVRVTVWHRASMGGVAGTMGRHPMLGCELLFSAEKAEKVQALVEESTGRPCPCKAGEHCPLLPNDLRVLPIRQVA